MVLIDEEVEEVDQIAKVITKQPRIQIVRRIESRRVEISKENVKANSVNLCAKNSKAFLSVWATPIAFPKNIELRKKWIHMCNRGERNWKPRADDRVCSIHFTENDYQRDVRAEVRMACNDFCYMYI